MPGKAVKKAASTAKKTVASKATPTKDSTTAAGSKTTDPQATQTQTTKKSNVTEQDNHENPSTLKQIDLHYTGEPKEQDQSFTYPTHTDPMRQLPKTSLYLDDVQRESAEIQRAKVEGREPDLENPPAIQGTPLLPSYVVQANLPGDHVVSEDVVLPVVVGRIDGEPEPTKVEAVPTYEVSKNDLDESGRVTV